MGWVIIDRKEKFDEEDFTKFGLYSLMQQKPKISTFWCSVTIKNENFCEKLEFSTIMVLVVEKALIKWNS